MNTIQPTDRFSFARFAAVLTNHLAGNCRIIYSILGIGYTIYLLMTICTNIDWDIFMPNYRLMLSNLQSASNFLFFFSTIAVASFITYDCSRKEQRISVLTLPALKSEKYLARIATIILLGPVLAFVVQLVTYSTVYVIGLADMPNTVAGAFRPFDNIRILIDGTGEIDTTATLFSTLGVIAIYLFFTAVYTLGGFIWHRHGFLATSAWIVIGGSILVNIIEIFSYFIVCPDSDEITRTIFFVVDLLPTVLMFALSYRVFTHMQVTRRKWRISFTRKFVKF